MKKAAKPHPTDVEKYQGLINANLIEYRDDHWIFKEHPAREDIITKLLDEDIAQIVYEAKGGNDFSPGDIRNLLYNGIEGYDHWQDEKIIREYCKRLR
jgi:hypothetical protein